MEEEKEKKVKKKIPKKLIVIACLAVAALIYLFGDCIKLPKAKSKGLTMDDYFLAEEMEKTLSAEESDIKGMTKWDKFQAGLSTDDGADSDMDGLTDKEEIEKYGSDPAKTSTSGDMYSDGYKVAHDMDLTKQYEYKNDLDFQDNSCKEVCLEATDASDFNAFISDLTGSGMYNMPKDKDIIKEYSVSLYSGNFAIDLSQIKDTPDAKNVNIYVKKDGNDKAKAAKFTADGDIVTLKKAFEYDQHYVVFLVNEKSTIFSSFEKADITYGSLDKNGEPERAYGIVYGWGCDVKVKYVETADKVTGEKARDFLATLAEEIVSERWFEGKHLSEENIIATTKEDVDMVARLSKKLCPQWLPLFGKCKSKIDTLDAYGAVYTYYIYDEPGEIPYAGGESSESEKDGKNTLYENMLPFSNFGTEYSSGGVCAGIAHLTSSLHNNGKNDSASGSFKSGETVYSWDLTQDPENETLLDKGLSDYKDADFVKNHKDSKGCVTKDLSEGEESFVNLLNYYLAKGNNSFSTYDYAKGIEGKDAGKDAWTMFFYDGTVIRNTIKELDKGNFVDAYFILNDGSGHAVNLVGYRKAETKLLGTKTDGYVFYVYDSNYPNVLGTLTCEIHEHSNGTESLIYSLNIPGANYTAHSGGSYNTKMGKINLFVVLDDEWNVLNNRK